MQRMRNLRIKVKPVARLHLHAILSEIDGHSAFDTIQRHGALDLVRCDCLTRREHEMDRLECWRFHHRLGLGGSGADQRKVDDLA